MLVMFDLKLRNIFLNLHVIHHYVNILFAYFTLHNKFEFNIFRQLINIKKMDTLLEFENQIYQDMFQNDALLILADGLGIERIFMNFIKLFCDPSHLVMILNTHDAEEQYFISKLKEYKEKENDDDFILPVKITTETHSMNERSQAYLQGGCFFVTSRYKKLNI